MRLVSECVIKSNKRITENIYDMCISSGEIASAALQGQFIQIYLPQAGLFLPRPFSICEILEAGVIRVVYQIVGKGTAYMTGLKPGDPIKIAGPLGTGFPINGHKSIILAGGGLGTAPLLELNKAIRKKNPASDIHVFIGARSKSFVILEDEFASLGPQVYVSTDDGSAGFHGNVLSSIKRAGIKADIIFACGPSIMLRGVSQYAAETGTECFVSMEERMACGLGACIGCAVKIKTQDDFIYKKVCADGPVFNSREVVWDE